MRADAYHRTLPASEVLALVEDERPGPLRIGALLPGGIAHVRLHATARALSRPEDPHRAVGLRGGAEETRERLIAAGADLVATSLEETRDQAATFVSLLASREPQDPPDAGTAVLDTRVVTA